MKLPKPNSNISHDVKIVEQQDRADLKCESANMTTSKMMQIVYTYYAVQLFMYGTTTKNVLLKYTEPSICCMAPNSPELSPVDYAVYELLWRALQQSMYCIPISSLDNLKDTVCTCSENHDQQIIDKSIDHGVTNWRLWSYWKWTHWTVVLTIWFVCCRALLCNTCILRTFVHFAIVYRVLR